MAEPRRGAVAYCSIGHLGLITSDKPEPVYYPDGMMGLAWTGRHIWPFEKFGEPWSSRTPDVVGYIQDEHGVFDYVPPKRLHFYKNSSSLDWRESQ